MSYYVGMTSELSIAELADAAGVSRRAVRFYVQEKLLDPPRGAGRGSHYEASHLDQLRHIAEWQRAGYSLDAIRRMLRGEQVPRPTEPVRPVRDAGFTSRLMSRVELMEGVELNFDAGRYSPAAEDLEELRQMARRIFGK